MLADGTYDGIVVDAGTDPAPDAPSDAVRFEIAILAGPHKGEVVAVRASGLAGDPIDRLGDPVTLTVSDGRPRFTFDL